MCVSKRKSKVKGKRDRDRSETDAGVQTDSHHQRLEVKLSRHKQMEAKIRQSIVFFRSTNPAAVNITPPENSPKQN